MKPEPELAYQGLDRCDGCGTHLEPEDRLWGFCPACLPPRKAKAKSTTGQEAHD